MIALWLASNIRRTIDLPAGATDPTRLPDEPPPHYYNVAEGAKYLNLVLSRSLKDNSAQSSAVALAAVKSLQNIVGQSNLFSGAHGMPLVEAMRYPDRQVRFEAAFALAAALPQQHFQGDARVVPLLAEAVSQSGTPGVLIVAPQGDRAKWAADLKGYALAGGDDPSTALADAITVPAIDVILMSEDLGGPTIDRVIDLASQNPRARAGGEADHRPLARLTVASHVADRSDHQLHRIHRRPCPCGGSGCGAEEGRRPADGRKSRQRLCPSAANLLSKLATTRGQILDLSVAEQTLLASLGDKPRKSPVPLAMPWPC